MSLSLDGDMPNSGGLNGNTDADANLVELARKGDTRGFAGLFQSYNAPICTYLARLVGDDEVGRDLAQETFLHVWKSLPDLHGELHFKAWLYRIATNIARSHLRHERLIRWLPWTEPGEHQPYNNQCIAGPEEQVSEMECVAQALAQLAPQCRACLLLQLVGGFKQREVALLLEISEKSVSAYGSRGREQFRLVYRRLKEEMEA